MSLSIKHPKSILWKTNWDTSSIEEAIQNSTINGSWLVCPLGESNKAITIDDYLQDTSVFIPEVKPGIQKEQTKENPLSLGGVGIITVLVAASFRFGLNTLFVVHTGSFTSITQTKFKVALWNLCDEVSFIGLCSGSAMIVAQLILNKNKLNN